VAGLYLLSGTAELSGSTISNNVVQGGRGGKRATFPNLGGTGIGGAAQGAGIYIGTGTVSVGETAISSNTAIPYPDTNSRGQDIECTGLSDCQIELGSSQGGGLFVVNGQVSLSNSTVFANNVIPSFEGSTSTGRLFVSTSAGGGIYLAGGTISLTGVTVASNQAGETRIGGYGPVSSGSGGGIANAGTASLMVSSTLIADNTQNADNPNNGNDDSGPISAAYSLIGQSEGATITNNGHNLLDVDPMLSTAGLTNNGGPTQTIALQEGSPAIDVIPLEDCTDQASPPNPLITDQRGFPRPDAGEANCDIGAYEFQDTPPVPFSSFAGLLRIASNSGVFLVSQLELGAGGTIDPATQPVAFELGSYAVRLPAGSFVSYGTGYLYEGTINGIFLSMFLTPTDIPGIYTLIANGNVMGTSNPLPVTLTIGDNFGSAQLNLTVN
jgi:hypothetical protein